MVEPAYASLTVEYLKVLMVEHPKGAEPLTIHMVRVRVYLLGGGLLVEPAYASLTVEPAYASLSVEPPKGSLRDSYIQCIYYICNYALASYA
jgi:hypothetical protein